VELIRDMLVGGFQVPCSTAACGIQVFCVMLSLLFTRPRLLVLLFGIGHMRPQVWLLLKRHMVIPTGHRRERAYSSGYSGVIQLGKRHG